MAEKETYNSIVPAALSDNELLSFRTQLDAELTRRGMNFSVGEIGEKVAIEYFYSTPGLPTNKYINYAT